VFYLIDGYNLMYAMGILPRPMGPKGLERARLAFLGFVKGAHGAEADRVTVVFDARRAPPDVPTVAHHQGVEVRFAVREGEADELIERLIAEASAPRRLTVVSDDHRIQQAARRRRCPVLGCEEYLSRREKRRRRPASRPEADAKPGPSREETRHWCAEFADLADDPDAKELFDPYGFLGDDRPR
jgi:hypothetical protein